MTDIPKKPRGFQCFTKEKLLAAASKGGANVPSGKRSFSKDKDLASRAAKKSREGRSGG